MKRILTTTFILLAIAGSGFGQSLTVEDKVTLTVTKIERVMERKVETPYGSQIHHPGKGAEFVKLTFAPRLLPDGTGDPCSFGSSVPLYKAGDYELVDSTDRKVLGMDVSWKGEPCQSFTVLFQPSPVSATFVKIRFNGSEADLSKVPGTKPSEEVKQ